MSLGWFSFVTAVFASYRLTRLIVEDDIFDAVRDPLLDWLEKGESRVERWVGWCLFVLAGWSAVEALTGIVAVAVGEGDARGGIMATRPAVGLWSALGLFIIGSVVGHRRKVGDLLSCRWCVGVWTSFAVTVSLAWWGHWPIVPSAVLGFATAGAQAFVNFAEDIAEKLGRYMKATTNRLESDDLDVLAALAASIGDTDQIVDDQIEG